jgi:hypothetical protein
MKTLYKVSNLYFKVNNTIGAKVSHVDVVNLVAFYTIENKRSGKVVFTPYEVATDIWQENLRTINKIKKEENYDKYILAIGKVNLDWINAQNQEALEEYNKEENKPTNN